ncbi:hypothetical protein A9Q89_03650 [Gammaproteobacteria bacterium 53_120_T64]|nr:hypothetical protein A9Q89_03650 [Gammaproteobacteria bacterium 53_120_T64]
MKKLFILLLAMSTLYGCTPLAVRTQNLVIPQNEKPSSIIGFTTSIALDNHPDYVSYSDSKINQLDMINIIEDTKLFNTDETAYIAKSLSEMSAKWAEPSNVIISLYEKPQAKFKFITVEEWGKVFQISYEVNESWLKQTGRALAQKMLLYSGGVQVKIRRRYDTNGNLVAARDVPTTISRFSDYGFIYRGKELDKENIERLNTGIWTKDAIRDLLGPPTEERMLTDGSNVILYHYKAWGRSKAHLANPLSVLVKDKIRHTQILEIRLVNNQATEHGFDECKDDCPEIL